LVYRQRRARNGSRNAAYIFRVHLELSERK
jgi:hypothetical protein